LGIEGRAVKTLVQGLETLTQGRLVKQTRLVNEGYEFVRDVPDFARALRASVATSDWFTVTRSIGSTLAIAHAESTADAGPGVAATPLADTDVPMQGVVHRCDEQAVLPLQSYEHWWAQQINDKTRNMVRKAGKKGVELRPFTLDDAAVRGIQAIYNEHPLRQGRPFKHYDKTLEVLHAEHATFADRSTFIGAYLGDQMIGFIKLVRQPAWMQQLGWASLMQIVSLVAHRDKAPTNALIAKAVALCTADGLPALQYGQWSRRSMGDFKLHHGFKPLPVGRWHVPLTLKGRAALALGWHTPLAARLPEQQVDRLVAWRSRWHAARVTARWGGPATGGSTS
jgi:hypothetical protein